jgi:hypothetical protein
VLGSDTPNVAASMTKLSSGSPVTVDTCVAIPVVVSMRKTPISAVSRASRPYSVVPSENRARIVVPIPLPIAISVPLDASTAYSVEFVALTVSLE